MLAKLLKLTLINFTAICLFAAPLTAETIEIGVVAGHPPVFRWVKHLGKTFIPTVNKELAGSGIKINWTESYGGTLAKPGGELEAIEEGLSEMGLVPTIYESAKLPLYSIAYYTPFAANDVRQVIGIIDQMLSDIPEVRQTWEKYNLEYLGGGVGIDDYHIWTKFPVKKVSDLKGHKIGAPGPAVNWFKGTGAIGVSSTLPQYYNSLKTGVFDGVVNFATAALPGKLYEVAPYITKVGFGTPYAAGLAANKKWFNRQPQALKNALRKAAAAYGLAYHQDLEQAVAASMKAMAAKGAKISELPQSERRKWANLLPNVAKSWAKGLDKKGLKGTKVLKYYMSALRKASFTPLRNWDNE